MNDVEVSQFESKVEQVFNEAMELLCERHAKYGPHNINHSPGGPLNGLKVRMHDKLTRITHGEMDFVDEKFRDALLDLGNYAFIGVMVLDGTWPK